MQSAIRSPIRSPISRALRSPFARGAGAAAPTLAAGAIGFWSVRDYSPTPTRNIPNRLATYAVEANKIRQPNGNFLYDGTAREGWNPVPYAPNSVMVDRVAPSADGFTNGSTWTVVAGTNAFCLNGNQKQAAGNYTVAVWLRSRTGANQDVRLTVNSGTTLVTRTVTTTRTRFFAQGTLAADDQSCVRIYNDAALSALNIEISDFKLYAGLLADAAVPVDIPETGHCYLGRGDNDLAPVITSNALNMGVSRSFMTWAQPTLVSGGTFMAVVSKTFTTTVAQPEIIFGSNQSNGQGFGLFDSDATLEPNAYFSNQPTAAIPGGMALNGKGFHCLAVTTNTAEAFAQVFLDDVPMVKTTLSAPTLPVLQDFVLGSFYSNRPSDYSLVTWAFWPRKLTNAEIKSSYLALKAEATLAGKTITPPSRVVCFEGDSIATFATSYAVKSIPNLSPPAFASRRSVPGATIASMTARAADVMAMVTAVNARGGKLILDVLIGANDLASSASTTQWLADLAAYCDPLRTAGALIVINTVLPQGTGVGSYVTHNARRAVVNSAMLSTWIGVHCAAIADIASDSFIGPDAAANNATYYNADTLHLTDAGHAKAEPYVTAAINLL